MTAADAATAIDPRTTDAELGAAAAEKFPIPLRAAIRDAVVAAIARERLRCAYVVHAGIRRYQKDLQKIEATIQLQAAAGNADEEMAINRKMCISSLGALSQAARAVAIPPGSCYACAGSGKIPGTVVTAGGARAAVDCPHCAGSGVAPVPPAAAADSS